MNQHGISVGFHRYYILQFMEVEKLSLFFSKIFQRFLIRLLYILIFFFSGRCSFGFHFLMQSGRIVLLLLWHAVHFIRAILYFIREILRAIESYLITNGFVKTYDDLNLNRVKYLGIVVDSDEARNTSKVVELLEWLSAIGVKKVCLYDREGKRAHVLL